MSPIAINSLIGGTILSALAVLMWDPPSRNSPTEPGEAPSASVRTLHTQVAPRTKQAILTRPAERAATQSTTSDTISDASWRSLREQIEEADRAFVEVPGRTGHYRAFNRARHLTFAVSSDGVEVRPRKTPAAAESQQTNEPDWFARLRVAKRDTAGLAQTTDASRIEIPRDEMTEWYVHREAGLEQGFTVEKPLEGHSDAITVELAVETSLTPVLSGDSRSVQFLDKSRQPALVYEKLYAYDATGQELPSQMLLASSGDANAIRLEVDTTDASYPVTIDPLLTTLPLMIPEDTVSVPDIGRSADQKRVVALDGTTLAVGEVLFDGSEGAVSIFYRQPDGSWQLVKRIQPTNSGIRYFGSSVAVDGDHLIVANRASPGSSRDDGAYIFGRNQGGADNWGQVVELRPSDANTLGFGSAVAIRGDWAFVGCQRGEVNEPTGRVYVYHQKEGGENNWGQIQRLLASAPQAFDSFGETLGVSPNGEFLVIGAPLAGGPLTRGAVHLFAAEAGAFIHAAEVVRPRPTLKEFGKAVAISDDSFAVSAPIDNDEPDFRGAVYLYDYSRSVTLPGGVPFYDTSDPQEILPPQDQAYKTFGHSLGLNANYLCIGHAEAKVGNTLLPEPILFYYRDFFGRKNQLWSLERVAFDQRSKSSSEFGTSFALSETHFASAASANKIVQVFAAEGVGDDQIGVSVCVESDTAVVGATHADGRAVFTGAVYVFVRNADERKPWRLQRKLFAPDGAGNDRFGDSAAVNGDIAVIGAPSDDDHGTNSGSVYVFGRNVGGNGNWGQIQKIAPSDTKLGDWFGHSVGIWSNRMIIGAPHHSAFGAGEGTAYVYESGILKTKFNGFLAGPKDAFGWSVSIDGDFAVVGAPFHDFVGQTDSGISIVFRRDPASGDWTEFSTLGHTDPRPGDRFGTSVTIRGQRVLVGAPFRNEAGKTASGVAYLYSPICVFACNETRRLVPPNPVERGYFGTSVALADTKAVVGTSVEPHTASGSIYVFDQHRGGAENWGLAMKRFPAAPARSNGFGSPVSASGDTIVVGAWRGHFSPGAVYFYEYDSNDPPTHITLNPSSILENKPAGTIVGELQVTDPDKEDLHTFSLVQGIGSSDNASFSIDGSQLLSAAVFDYETHPLCRIRVRATDQTGDTFEKALAVQIIDDESEDLDGDGLTQLHEKNFGTSDDDRDSDNDGIEDGVEHHCLNSHPGDPKSGPFRISIVRAPTTVTLTWSSQPGVTYIIDQSANLRGKWDEVPESQITATGVLTTRVIPAPPSSKQMFYHVRLPNCQLPHPSFP